MKTIKNSKDITTLEVGDKVVFWDSEYIVCKKGGYFLRTLDYSSNDKIFIFLGLSKIDFIKNLGIDADCNFDFPETKSLEALTAVVSALFKEYEKQNELPKTWEEFCDKHPVTLDEYWIETVYSRYCNSSRGRKRDINMDKNVCVSLQEAKAFTALMQLRQLRKCYVGDWEPKLGGRGYYGIVYTYNGIKIEDYQWNYRSLSFPTYELAEQFLTNFKDLLEIAKPLL
jgi:hypothetical protein